MHVGTRPKASVALFYASSMPSLPVGNSFISKELTGGTLAFVKYLAQIGNRREKFGKRNDFVPSP